MNNQQLIEKALEAREKSYSPYSKFKVGAALLTTENQVFLGCNIENASYTPSNCAERTAFFKAISDGVKEFKKIAIVGGYEDKNQDFCTPCGVCLQVMAEFCDFNTFEVVLSNSQKDIKIYLLKDLLPHGFSL